MNVRKGCTACRNMIEIWAEKSHVQTAETWVSITTIEEVKAAMKNFIKYIHNLHDFERVA